MNALSNLKLFAVVTLLSASITVHAAVKTDCSKSDNKILAECQLPEIKGDMVGSPFFKAAQAEAIRRLTPTEIDDVVIVKAPRCGATAMTYDSNNGQLHASFLCEMTGKYSGSTPLVQTSSIRVNVLAHVQNEFELYYAVIDSITLKSSQD